MEQESLHDNKNVELKSVQHNEDFDYQSLSEDEQSRLITLKSGQKVILTPDNNPSKAFDPKTGEFIDILPGDISEQRA